MNLAFPERLYALEGTGWFTSRLAIVNSAIALAATASRGGAPCSGQGLLYRKPSETSGVVGMVAWVSDGPRFDAEVGATFSESPKGCGSPSFPEWSRAADPSPAGWVHLSTGVLVVVNLHIPLGEASLRR
uniref:Uncharacterized protein n=1 Tax=Trichuris muris TaxID=70415 RepID=A0A5S6QHB7_TRIMR